MKISAVQALVGTGSTVVFAAAVDEQLKIPLGTVITIIGTVWGACWWLARKLQNLEDGRMENMRRIEAVEKGFTQLINERRHDSDNIRAQIARLEYKPQQTILAPRQEDRSKLMLVDDDPVFHEMFIRKFRLYFDIVPTKNLEEAFMRLESADDISCVLLDMKIPPLSGEEVLQKFRGIHPTALALVLSGYESPELIEAAKLHNIEAYLHKDLVIGNPSYVVEIIKTAISRRSTALLLTS